jgi:hypothetical protein
MQKGFNVLMETFTCALVLMVRYRLERQGEKKSRVLR